MENVSMWEAIGIIVVLNLAFFFRTLRYQYAVDDWENVRCHCAKPDFIKATMNRGGKPREVEICNVCHILKGVNPKNLFEKFAWSFGGFYPVKDEHGESKTTCQYQDGPFDHMLTIILHTINCVLMYFAFGHNNVSLLSALFFSIHPMAMQGSSVWMSGKGYSMGLTFCLLAYWIMPFAPLFYALGSFYVAVLVLPLVFLKTKFWFLVFMLPVGFYFRKKNLKEAVDFKYRMVLKTRNPLQWHNAILVPKTIGYYFSMCMIPTRMGVHHEYLQMHGVTPEETKESLSFKDKFFWIGIALILITPILFFFHWGPVAFGLMWFMIFIAPWTNWMAAVHQPISERYGIIATAGALYALASVVITYPIVAGMLFAYYATITNQFMPAYMNILEFAVYNVHNFPNSFQGWLWKSDIERNFQLTERSFDSAMRAWMLRPNDFLVNNNIATMLLQQRKYKDAEAFLDRMEKADLYCFELEEKRKEKMKAIRSQIAEDMNKIQQFAEGRKSNLCFCGSGKHFSKCHGGENATKA